MIGDPHAHPDYDNDRFERAGLFAIEERVDLVVCLGDWFDYASLCKHAKKKEREGKRLVEETRAGIDALRRFEAPFVEKAKRRKQALQNVAPARHLILGNHDVRPEAYADELPELEGALAQDRWDPFLESGWNLHPFKTTVSIEGWAFCHYMASGLMARPVSGSSSALLARNLVLKGHQNTIVGHDHRFGIAKEERWDGRKLYGISAGCYVHHEYTEGWCKQSEPMWDRGLLVLDLDENGDHLAHRWVTSKELRRKYA